MAGEGLENGWLIGGNSDWNAKGLRCVDELGSG